MNRRMMCRATLVAILFTISTAFCQIASPIVLHPLGHIDGSVQGADGTPLANAVVAINVRPAALAGSFQPFNTTVTTAADGTFSVAGVPDGKFAVCPTAPNTALLPPCMWGSEIVATVVNGQPVTLPAIKLKPSVDFYVRVNDPRGTLASTQGKVNGASLHLAIRSPNGMVAPIPVTASDAAGFDYHLSVPPATNLFFIASSNTFSLVDASGAAISPQAGLNQMVNIPASQPQYRQVITVK